jgi:hypothetical protein
VVTIKIPNSKLIKKGESALISSESSSSAATTGEAFREQLGKILNDGFLYNRKNLAHYQVKLYSA